MAKTLNFLKFDFLLLKSHSVAILILFVAGIFIGPLGYLIVILIAMPYPFLAAEKNNLNVLYSVLPTTRKSIVLGRHLFALITVFVATLISFLGSMLLPLIAKQDIVMNENILTLCLITALSLIMTGIQYPLYFKLGYSKARIISLIPVVIIFAVAMFITTVTKGLFGWNIDLTGMLDFVFKNAVLSCVVALIVSILSICVSCVLSCKLYEKKDI